MRSLFRGPGPGAIRYSLPSTPAPPHADDVLSLSFDGIRLFNKAFGAFRPGHQPDVYLLTKRRLLVRLNLNNNRLYVMKGKANLRKFDNANGVDVELTWGAHTAVDRFVTTPIAAGVWIYDRNTDENNTP